LRVKRATEVLIPYSAVHKHVLYVDVNHKPRDRKEEKDEEEEETNETKQTKEEEEEDEAEEEDKTEEAEEEEEGSAELNNLAQAGSACLFDFCLHG
jgi:hypothetical protein